MVDLQTLNTAISTATGEPFVATGVEEAGGGCINSAIALEGGGGRRYFVKLNKAERVDMFAAEAEGLREIGRAQALRVPTPVCWGIAGNHAYLVLEFLDLVTAGDASQEHLGHVLAALHRVTAPVYGWHRDNTIGSTPQRNTTAADWIDFWRRRRLGYQLELAYQRGHAARLESRGSLLLENLQEFFVGHRPVASLLHGDLWSGNASATAGGEPVVFDPAVYYGDRETDLAMTELFGGFSAIFYKAYNADWPLAAGYATRKSLYNLYHVLNHLNLFGGAYLTQAEHLLDRLLSEVR